MRNQVKWNARENSVYLQLPTFGPIAKKIRMLEIILYGEAFNLFVVKKKRNKSRRLKHQTQTIKMFETKDVRNKMKHLAKAMILFQMKATIGRWFVSWTS